VSQFIWRAVGRNSLGGMSECSMPAVSFLYNQACSPSIPVARTVGLSATKFPAHSTFPRRRSQI